MRESNTFEVKAKTAALLLAVALFGGGFLMGTRSRGTPNADAMHPNAFNTGQWESAAEQHEAQFWGAGQRIDMDICAYYGSYKVDGMVGEGYVYDETDPHGEIMDGILSLSLDQARFDGPAGSIVLDKPRYVAFLDMPYDFSGTWRGAYSSFDFYNAYIVRVDIYDGDDLWRPYGIGPIWLKDWDTLIIRHHAYHELTRIAH